MRELRLHIALGLGVSAITAMACGDNDGITTRQECNPLGGTNCITPWPSAIYEIDDSSTATGRRLDIPEGALPTNTDGIPISPALFNDRDGFSSAAPIITAFPDSVDPSNLVHYSHYEDSLTDASPTVLVNMDTGELVAHFAEIDARVPEQPEKQALYIRPAQLLPGGTRFAVAIKRTLKSKDGSELPIPDGFQSILSGTTTNHDRLERVRPRYDAIFAALAEHGIEPEDLVTAWDFTTASRESMRADVVATRNIAMPAMGDVGANLKFSVSEDRAQEDTRIARRIDGEYDAPLFLTQDGRFTPATTMARDTSGGPQMMGMYKSPFTAIVPACALDGRGPVPIMLYGHGLLGDSGQVASGAVRDAAAELCVVAVGTDMRGMSTADTSNVAMSLNDLNKGPLLFDGLIQGVINHLALAEVARGPMAQELFVDGSGTSIVDPSRVFYYGISQGGIFGATHCAWSPVIDRCVLQVGAINYSMMLERSLDWPIHRTVLIGAYPDPLDVAINIGLLQMMWDRTDPVSIADVLLEPDIGDYLPGASPKQVLLEIGVADTEVSNIASHYGARTMGLPLLAPSVVEPYGLTPTEGPLSSAMVVYDYGLGDTIPATNEPPLENDVHSFIRKEGSHFEMMKNFIETGVITQTCTAPNGCDCTADGCGVRIGN